jgi:hypothetical protein
MGNNRVDARCGDGFDRVDAVGGLELRNRAAREFQGCDVNTPGPHAVTGSAPKRAYSYRRGARSATWLNMAEAKCRNGGQKPASAGLLSRHGNNGMAAAAAVPQPVTSESSCFGKGP